MAVIHTNFRSSADYQTALNARTATGLSLVDAFFRVGGSFSEAIYGNAIDDSVMPNRITGHVIGGGTYVIEGSSLDDALPATVTYLRYNDNSPPGRLEIFAEKILVALPQLRSSVSSFQSASETPAAAPLSHS